MATYKLIGKRFLRKYTEPKTSPVYAASVQAQAIVAALCGIPWEPVAAKDATMTYHTDENVGTDESPVTGLDRNVQIRDRFDAALFCADHKSGQHRAYANAAVYRYVMPDAAVGMTLTSLIANVTSDPYNSRGARIHVFTNSTGTIPTNCSEIRGEDSSGVVVADGTTAAEVAKRTVETVSGKDYWYPTTESATISPTGGLTLQKYLFVTVCMESYSTVRGNWIEGCSFIENGILVELSATCAALSETGANDLTGDETGVFIVDPGEDHTPMRRAHVFKLSGDVEWCSSVTLISGDSSIAVYGAVDTPICPEIPNLGIALVASDGGTGWTVTKLQIPNLAQHIPTLCGLIAAGKVKIAGVCCTERNESGIVSIELVTDKVLANHAVCRFSFELSDAGIVSNVDSDLGDEETIVVSDLRPIGRYLYKESAEEDGVDFTVAAGEFGISYLPATHGGTYSVPGSGFETLRVSGGRIMYARQSDRWENVAMLLGSFSSFLSDDACSGMMVLYNIEQKSIGAKLPLSLDNYDGLTISLSKSSSMSQSVSDTETFELGLCGKFTTVNGVSVPSGCAIVRYAAGGDVIAILPVSTFERSLYAMTRVRVVLRRIGIDYIVGIV